VWVERECQSAWCWRFVCTICRRSRRYWGCGSVGVVSSAVDILVVVVLVVGGVFVEILGKDGGGLSLALPLGCQGSSGRTRNFRLGPG